MKFLYLLPLIFLFGCSNGNDIKPTDVVEVKIPVPVCIDIQTQTRPDLKIKEINDSTPRDIIVKSYVSDILSLIQYSKSLENNIEKYESGCKIKQLNTY
jgi:uncharacterized membrane protein